MTLLRVLFGIVFPTNPFFRGMTFIRAAILWVRSRIWEVLFMETGKMLALFDFRPLATIPLPTIMRVHLVSYPEWYDRKLTLTFYSLTRRLLCQYLPGWRPSMKKSTLMFLGLALLVPSRFPSGWMRPLAGKPHCNPRCRRLRRSIFCIGACPHQSPPPLHQITRPFTPPANTFAKTKPWLIARVFLFVTNLLICRNC